MMKNKKVVFISRDILIKLSAQVNRQNAKHQSLSEKSS